MEAIATPRITCAYLNSYVGKNVIVVGKVVQIRGEEALIDADGNITAHLNRVSFSSPPTFSSVGFLASPFSQPVIRSEMRRIETRGIAKKGRRRSQRETSARPNAPRPEKAPKLTMAPTHPPGGPSFGRKRRPDHRQSQPGPLHQSAQLPGPKHGRR